VPGVCRGQKRVFDALVLELQIVVSFWDLDLGSLYEQPRASSHVQRYTHIIKRKKKPIVHTTFIAAVFVEDRCK